MPVLLQLHMIWLLCMCHVLGRWCYCYGLMGNRMMIMMCKAHDGSCVALDVQGVQCTCCLQLLYAHAVCCCCSVLLGVVLFKKCFTPESMLAYGQYTSCHTVLTVLCCCSILIVVLCCCTS